MPLGLYISVPFCRTKCTYCNFASDVFSRAVFEKYVSRVCADIEHAEEAAGQIGGSFPRSVDSIYFGGGTPTLLTVEQVEQVFVTIGQNFELQPQTEITLECAPGTLSDEMLVCLGRCGVNRVSLGVQSFVDEEARSVGRLHNREAILRDIARLRSAGISNINVDVIAGLPHQTRESWGRSLDEMIASGVPHASVYMLEIDEDSRLGRELIAGGQKYHAHFVPDEDLTADFYEIACERLNAAGIEQYEISNFARPGFESRHNLKYWTRQPYLGFGVDAHSMLPAYAQPSRGSASRPEVSEANAVRFCNSDNLEFYLSGSPVQQTLIAWEAALQEACFLGLRLTKGINLDEITSEFGRDALEFVCPIVAECIRSGLMEHEGSRVRLTAKGRLLSNEVFEKFLTERLPLSP